MKFRDIFKNPYTLRYLIFGLILIAATIGFSFIDSADDVAVTFNEDSVLVKSDNYQMSILYNEITDVQLTDIADSGDSIDGKDTMVLRIGSWKNETWGEYFICADLDATNCIVVTIKDGRTLVFSRKNNSTTAEIYEQLLTYIDG